MRFGAAKRITIMLQAPYAAVPLVLVVAVLTARHFSNVL
jgi:hypothetical protein